MDSRYFVKFTGDDGSFVRVLLNSTAANLTDGFGGWEVVDRPKRIGITRFKGQNPLQMDVPILFDGAALGENQEPDISTLVFMARQPSLTGTPPLITVEGPVPRSDLVWVINNISWDNQDVMWDVVEGMACRIRQAAVVTLLEYVDDTVIITNPSPAIKGGGGKSGAKSKQGSGKNAKEEAQIEYGNADLWDVITGANPWIPTPRWPIPVGSTFIVPPKSSLPTRGPGIGHQ